VDLSQPGGSAGFLELYAAQGTMTEGAPAVICVEGLGIKPVGILDIFFEPGGHSRLVTWGSEPIHVELSRDFFGAPTIAELAATVEEALVREIPKRPAAETGGLVEETELLAKRVHTREKIIETREKARQPYKVVINHKEDTRSGPPTARMRPVGATPASQATNPDAWPIVTTSGRTCGCLACGRKWLKQAPKTAPRDRPAT